MMIELQLVGLHNDDDHIVLIDRDGQRFTLPIDEALRAAVRRDRPRLAQAGSEAVRPKEIQSLIRQGLTAEEISQRYDVSIDHVQRYEGPVLAEREYVSSRAQQLSLGIEPGAPTLGDIVVDRLAARGASLNRWDAVREGNNPWNVVVHFVEENQNQQATWNVDLQTGHINPLDDHARMLSERQLDRRRGSLSPAHDPSFSNPAPGPVETSPETSDPLADTESVLAQLDQRRGARVSPADPEYVELAEEFDAEDVPAAHPPHSQPELAQDATILAWNGPTVARGSQADAPAGAAEKNSQGHSPAQAAPPVSQPPAAPKPPAEPEDARKGQSGTSQPPRSTADAKKPTKRRTGKRTSVPSWDEIVFGTKPEP